MFETFNFLKNRVLFAYNFGTTRISKLSHQLFKGKQSNVFDRIRFTVTSRVRFNLSNVPSLSFVCTPQSVFSFRHIEFKVLPSWHFYEKTENTTLLNLNNLAAVILKCKVYKQMAFAVLMKGIKVITNRWSLWNVSLLSV